MFFFFFCISQESFSLFNAKKWLQAVVKGDSMLIIYKMNVRLKIPVSATYGVTGGVGGGEEWGIAVSN